MTTVALRSGRVAEAAGGGRGAPAHGSRVGARERARSRIEETDE